MSRTRGCSGRGLVRFSLPARAPMAPIGPGPGMPGPGHALLTAGHSRRSVQQQLGMAYRTVKQVFAEASVDETVVIE
ncbi:hypothetical protein ABZS88_26460 [Streptomyces sp. NPDC005480]|uniref:hypothetical protein n=1 Tax=Streptomyces sp. NPDC005480 TaxID=3154880 RepID=UPI0033A32D43